MKIEQLIQEVGTDTSGKWMRIDNVKELSKLILDECIDIANQTRYDGTVVANRIKFVFGIESENTNA